MTGRVQTVADLYVYARRNRRWSRLDERYLRGEETYFIVLELSPDCFFRWTHNDGTWHKLFPRAPIPTGYQ